MEKRIAEFAATGFDTVMADVVAAAAAAARLASNRATLADRILLIKANAVVRAKTIAN